MAGEIEEESKEVFLCDRHCHSKSAVLSVFLGVLCEARLLLQE
jgi:hypothetical protein